MVRPPDRALTLFVVVPPTHPLEEPPTLREAIGRHADIVVGCCGGDYAQVADRAEVMMTWHGGNPRSVLEETGIPPTLRWIHHSGIGVDQFLFEDLVVSDVTITNIRGGDFYARPMAEYALALMLVFAKRLVEVAAQQRERRWRKLTGFELRGRTVGVIGLGTIGTAVAELCLRLGMRVVATRRDASRGGPAGVTVYPPSETRTLLAESDYVVLCTPRTRETEALIDATSLAAMKRTAVLVNLGRGGLVDADALGASLAAGELRGAALDVFSTEPLPSDSRLWDVPNLLVSPHMSALVEGEDEAEVGSFIDNFERYRSGDALLRVVDKQRGY